MIPDPYRVQAMSVVALARTPSGASRRLGVSAWLVCGVSVAFGLAGVVLVALGGAWDRFITSGRADAPAIAIAGGIFGAVIVRHRPHNPVGWLFLVNAFCYGLRNLVEQYAVFDLVHRAGSLPAGGFASWAATPPLIVSAAALALIILLFPDGTPTSPRWRWVAVATAALTVGSLLAVGTLSWPLRGPGLLDGATAPPGPRGRAFAAVVGMSQGLLAVCGVLAAVSLVLRYRRTTGIGRRQLKWFALGAVPSITLIIGYHFVGGIGGGVLSFVASFPLLAGLTVAIVRYRLYDIDRLISTTVSYASLTVVLVGVYLVASTLLGRVLGTAGGDSTLTTAGAAVAATALFQPLRRPLQDAADRRFRRRSYEATAVLVHYLDELREREPVPGALSRAVGTALGDPAAQIGLWLARDELYVDDEGIATLPPPPGSDQVATQVNRGAEHLGILVHRRALLAEEPDLVDAVAHAAGVAFDHARLRAQVMVQLREVNESRARILAAGDAERRRVERDLHDGAQQRLVGLGLALRRLRVRADRHGDAQLASELERTAGDVQAAITELRELARGLMPPILSERGLLAAISSLAERSPVPTTVSADCDRRYPAPVETAAYYVVAEALANVAKHAVASRTQITVTNRVSGLEVLVADDGVGGARLAGGSGLSGLRDRVDAVGGHLSVTSDPGRGTRIVAELPT